jgi:hypothetical protein
MKSIISLILVFAFFCMSCASSVGVRFDYPKNLPNLDVALPDRPDKDPITPELDYSIPLQKGNIASADGVLLSPAKIARLILWTISYNDIRTRYEQDRIIFKQIKIIYDERLNQAQNEIDRLQPTFWDKNGPVIILLAGFIAGSLITTGIVIGLKNL